MHDKFGGLLISGFLLLMGQTGLFAQEPIPQSPGGSQPVLLSKDAVKFQPASPETGDKLTVQIKMSEQVSSAELRWSINGEHFDTVFYDGAAGSVELNKAIKSGDVIEVEVIPYDLSGTAGRAIRKKVVCRKGPPTIKLAEQKIEGNVYRAKIEARDPEDQPVSLSVDGPEGMVIDHKGAITWNITEKTTGRFDVKVTAKDKDGGKAVLNYSFRISRK
jgi:hypothetical protein